MNDKQLAERFCELWLRHAGLKAQPEPVWDLLARHYREPHRFYHNLDHIVHCLGELDAARAELEEFDATEMAIWFHDVIYHYGAKDNETLSAHTFRDLAEPAMPAPFINRVCEFIIATQHTGSAWDTGAAFVSIPTCPVSGLPWRLPGRLDALRLEAPNVTDEQYYAGRAALSRRAAGLEKPVPDRLFQGPAGEPGLANIQRYSADQAPRGFEA